MLRALLNRRIYCGARDAGTHRPGNGRAVIKGSPSAVLRVTTSCIFANRFFLYEDEKQASEELERVLKLPTSASPDKNDSEALEAPKMSILDLDYHPVSLLDWLIGPPIDEVERILVRN